jgi:hypothetical protein
MMPDVNAGFEEDPQGYDGERDAMGFQDQDHAVDGNDEAAVLKAFEEHYAKVDTNSDGFIDYTEVRSFARLFVQLVVSLTHRYLISALVS